MFFFKKYVAYCKKWKGDFNLKENVFSFFRRGLIEVFIAKKKLGNLVKTNFELGVYHVDNGNVWDALLRFKILEFLGYGSPELWYRVCHCYMEQFRFSNASHYIGLYEQSRDQKFLTEIAYYRKLIAKEEISEVPFTIIASKFNRLSSRYDDLYLQNKKVAPQMSLCEKLAELIKQSPKPFGNSVLDLGCGTGIIGQFFKESRLASAIVGVDIAQSMVKKAANRVFEGEKTYLQIFLSDVVSFLNVQQEREVSNYDIILLADLITYCNKLQEIVTHLDKFAHEGSILALSFKTVSNVDWHFSHKLAEFHYSASFVQKVCESLKWNMIESTTIAFLNKDCGCMMILKKQ